MSLANSIDSTRSRGGSLTTVGILGPPENEVFFPEEFKRAELKLCLSDICSWTTDPVKFKEALCKTLKNLYLCVWGLDSSATAEVYKYISSRIKETYGNPRGIALELQDLREIIQHNHGCVGHCWQIRTRLHQLKKWRMALEVSVESEKVSSSLKSQSIHTWYVERLVYLRTVTNKCWGQLKHIPQQEVATSISLRLLIMNDNEDDNGTDASTAQISQLETVADSESSQKTSGIRVNHGSLAGKQLDTVGGKFSENPTDWEIVRHPYIQRVPPDADFGKCVRKGLSLFRLPPSVQDRYRDLWARDSQNRVEGGYLQNKLNPSQRNQAAQQLDVVRHVLESMTSDPNGYDSAGSTYHETNTGIDPRVDASTFLSDIRSDHLSLSFATDDDAASFLHWLDKGPKA